MRAGRFSGMSAFRILWAGQAVSLLGTGMTRFAVMIWAYEQDGRATTLALLGFFTCITYVITSPFAGVLVDRWDRRKVMVSADIGAGLMTVGMLGLYISGNLELWHLYLAEGLAGAFEAFQEPAFTASVSLLVPKEKYTQANGMLGLGKSAARVFAPAFAGLVQQFAGLTVVMGIDLFTLALAVLGLLLITVPTPDRSQEGLAAKGSFWHEISFGTGYIWKRAGLRSILFIFFLINLFGTLTYFAVHSPMILARTGGDEVALGIVRTIMGAGGIAGGLLITMRSKFKRKANVFLISTGLSFLVCDFLTAVSRSTAGWSAAGFLSELTIPFIVAPYYALWQEIVPSDVQGRVFSTREMVQVTSQPAGYLIGGVLADGVFEPLMQTGGVLAGPLGWLVGTGPGAGMAVMFLCTALLGGLTGVLGLLSPSIRALDNQIDEENLEPLAPPAPL